MLQHPREGLERDPGAPQDVRAGAAWVLYDRQQQVRRRDLCPPRAPRLVQRSGDHAAHPGGKPCPQLHRRYCTGASRRRERRLPVRRSAACPARARAVQVKQMDELLTLEFDGGSRGNPGPAGIGAVVRASDGTPLVTLGRYIGRATNNVAEYKALITALQKAKELGAKKVVVRGDSELIVRQMNGQYKVKNADLKPLYEEAQ